MLNAGLIGLGPEWDLCYKPALAKLQHRLRVRCVHTAVIAHAEQAAADLQCQIAPGLMALVEREDVQALLILDAAWYAGVPAQMACQVGKPAYLGGRIVPRLSSTDNLSHRAAESGVTLMPDFGHRYTPSTSRLRELIATRLGRPLAILVDVAAPDEILSEELAPPSIASREALAATIDWCTNIIGTAPAAVKAAVQTDDDEKVVESNASHLEIQVEFLRSAAGGPTAVACIRLNRPSEQSAPGVRFDRLVPAMQARVQCAKGTVWLEDPAHVTWELAGEHKSESLLSDRPAIEVMLDHFARRVVGGLLPVPTLDDLYRAHALVEAALAAKPA